MRKVAIVTVKVAVDLGNDASDAQAAAADLLYVLLTCSMQRFNNGRGSLVDWTFADAQIPVLDAPDEVDYAVDSIFIDAGQTCEYRGPITCAACGWAWNCSKKV